MICYCKYKDLLPYWELLMSPQDVAVNLLSKQEYSEDVMQSFRQEVSLMKRLRHLNVLLFMGAVTSPQRLCIVSEFLPRFGLIDWRQFVKTGLETAYPDGLRHSSVDGTRSSS